MSKLWSDFAVLIERGGPVMIPLFALSIVSLTLIVERMWFWGTVHRPRRLRMLQQLREAFRRGDREAARRLSGADRSPYGEVGRSLLEHGATEAVAVEAVERQRPKFDRFMVSLSTIITASTLLGILGTVTGIIKSFRLLGEHGEGQLTDPSAVSLGIAEALLTTALGLVVALITLFPYMIFRAQSDRAMGRVETLIAAAQLGVSGTDAERGPVEIETAAGVRARRGVKGSTASAR